MSARIAKFLVCMLAVAGGSAPAAADRATAADTARTTEVSVMTYNVHGLPWPIAEDRSAALSAIAAQLRAMRAVGRQPGIVALQEAFVPDAKAIGAAAGYRYAAFGADADSASPAATLPDQRFMAQGTLFRGERLGKHVGSGLAIFSDFPILAARRISYPVCAGYDCLANKGALAAVIAIPGATRPVTVIDTHLNSNGATGVPRPRALYAFQRQIDVLSDFIDANVRPGAAMLVAGDFNVGPDGARRRYFAGHLLAGPTTLTSAGGQCRTTLTCRVTQVADVATSAGRDRDFLMYRAPDATDIRPAAMSAPFGHVGGGGMLSDHIGIMINYAFAAPTVKASAITTLASRGSQRDHGRVQPRSA